MCLCEIIDYNVGAKEMLQSKFVSQYNDTLISFD